MNPQHILRDTLASVLAELERLDPKSLIAARAHGVLLMAGGTEQPQSKGGRRKGWRKAASGTDRAIAASYVDGLTADECAEKHGTSKPTVYAALKRVGTPRRAPGRKLSGKSGTLSPANEQRLERMNDMRAKGMTLEEIGAAERITRERVRQIFAKAGIPTTGDERPLTAEQKAAVARYVAGDGLEVTAGSLGVSPYTMRGLISKAGYTVRPSMRQARQPKTIADAERAAQMYRSGCTCQQIADTLGLKAGSQVYRLLGIAGVKPSRHSRAHLVLNGATASVPA